MDKWYLSPNVAEWIERRFSIESIAIRNIGLERARDLDVFEAGRAAGVVFVTKDADFAALVESRGPPPQIVWLTCGNTSNANLIALMEKYLPSAIALLERGEALIEIA